MSFPLEESCLLAAEQALGARLPESYRQAMLRANGGDIAVTEDDWQLHPIADTSERRRIARTANHVLKETATLQSWPDFPRAALAIACNGSGDALLFMRRDGDFEPTVYAWSHETGELSAVAHDFAELKAA